MKDEFFFFFRNFLGKMEGDVYLGLYFPVFWLFEFFSSFPLPLSPPPLSLSLCFYLHLIPHLPSPLPLPSPSFHVYSPLPLTFHPITPTLPHSISCLPLSFPSNLPSLTLYPSPSTPPCLPSPYIPTYPHPSSLPPLTLHPSFPLLFPLSPHSLHAYFQQGLSIRHTC